MLTHNQDKHRDKPLSDQAIQWFVRLNSGERREIDTRQFEQWLAASHAHRRAFERVEEMWQKMDGLKTASFPELDQAIARWEAGDLSGKRRKPFKLFSSFRLQLAMAAMVVVIIAGAWFWNSFQTITMSYQTAPGEQKTITLADGSTIEINTNTSITVKMSAKSRKVILSKGEAFFTVAHEKKRPFEVAAGRGTIRALGTRFNVYKRLSGVTVSVIEGSVRICTKADYGVTTEVHEEVLKQGRQLFYLQSGAISSLGAVNIKEVSAWREGKLIFDEMPLAEVIQEVNRYRTGQIRITDPDLKDLKVSGVFKSDDFDSILGAIEQVLPVKARRVSEELVMLEHADGP
jgi:transmembrane sensor